MRHQLGLQQRFRIQAPVLTVLLHDALIARQFLIGTEQAVSNVSNRVKPQETADHCGEQICWYISGFQVRAFMRQNQLAFQFRELLYKVIRHNDGWLQKTDDGRGNIASMRPLNGTITARQPVATNEMPMSPPVGAQKQPAHQQTRKRKAKVQRQRKTGMSL